MSQVISLPYVFYHNGGMLLQIMGIRSTSSFSYMDTVLSSVITVYYSATMMAGYSVLGFYSVEIIHSFKFIRTRKRFT